MAGEDHTIYPSHLPGEKTEVQRADGTGPIYGADSGRARTGTQVSVSDPSTHSRSYHFLLFESEFISAKQSLIQMFMVLSGKMELHRVNPFMPTAEASLVFPHHRGDSNYSLQKSKSRQTDFITTCRF